MNTAHELAVQYCSNLSDETATKAIGDAFIAGFDARQPKWIPVTERLPDAKGVYGSCVLALIGKSICICNYTTGRQIVVDDQDDNETLIYDHVTGNSYLPHGWYELEQQTAGEYDQCWLKRSPSHWCPIPESLLNFKP